MDSSNGNFVVISASHYHAGSHCPFTTTTQVKSLGSAYGSGTGADFFSKHCLTVSIEGQKV